MAAPHDSRDMAAEQDLGEAVRALTHNGNEVTNEKPLHQDSETSSATKHESDTQAEVEHAGGAPHRARFGGATQVVSNHDVTGDLPGVDKVGTYDKIEITEEDCYEELGFSFPTWKKWTILTVIFIVQVSMNFNTSLYSNAIPGISEEFGVSAQAARCGAMIFLVAYAFGCELWAPWSEEIGRKPILRRVCFWSISGNYLLRSRRTLPLSWSAEVWAVFRLLVAQ
jgi:hypothetical protein